MGLLNPGGPIAQFKRSDCSISPVEVISLSGVHSAGIEFTQYRFGLGLAEVDDVIHNTLGTLLGAIACGASIKLPKT